MCGDSLRSFTLPDLFVTFLSLPRTYSFGGARPHFLSAHFSKEDIMDSVWRILGIGTLIIVAGLAAISTLGTKASGTFSAVGMTLGGNGWTGSVATADLPSGNTEAYDHIVDNAFQNTMREPLSTFSIDVDTASYSNIRRFLDQEHRLPPQDAVRIEEMINYFPYSYPEPKGEHPVTITSEVSECPWKPEHRLVRIGLQAKRIHPDEMPPRNLVFLIDVSGSMNAPNRLPLVKRSLEMLVEQLTERDRVAIVVYAGNSGLALPPTRGDAKARILAALNNLEAGGSTNGGQGIQLAYRVAEQNQIEGAVNRVILATDGDFNVGVTSQSDLIRLIEEKRNNGIFLTVLGYGMGNLKDATLEKLADHGDGHYAYIDTVAEARKVFVEQGAALVPVAKDVKIQVEFNPLRVASYRLIGYENRILKAEDFNNDRKDAGDMGAGHTVTALYECVPLGTPIPADTVDPLRYQKPGRPTLVAESKEMLTVKVRYKEPTEKRSKLLSEVVRDECVGIEEASEDHRFSAAVAAFGMILRESPHKGTATCDSVLKLARPALGKDPAGHRAEFLRLVQQAARLR
jgi:Ca-activated chloride channel family protein